MGKIMKHEIKANDRVLTPVMTIGRVIYISTIDAMVETDTYNYPIGYKLDTLVYIPQLQFANVKLGVDQIKQGAMVMDRNNRFHYITRLIDVPKAGWEINTMICTTNTAISFYAPDDLTYIG
jgi:hypothetical protein